MFTIAKTKEKRAAYMRRYRAAKSSTEEKIKQNTHKKHYRASKSSADQKTKHNEYMRNCRPSKASVEEKAKHNAYMKQYRENDNVQFWISKCHNMINQGPLYVCTCCDQLLYKHSALNDDKLRQSNSDILKREKF